MSLPANKVTRTFAAALYQAAIGRVTYSLHFLTYKLGGIRLPYYLHP